MPDSYFDAVRGEYQRRRDVLYEALTADPGVLLRRPRGAFYMIVQIAGIQDADHFTRWLLSDFQLDGETVMLAPANGFYATPGAGSDQVRIAFAPRDASRIGSSCYVGDRLVAAGEMAFAP